MRRLPAAAIEARASCAASPIRVGIKHLGRDAASGTRRPLDSSTRQAASAPWSGDRPGPVIRDLRADRPAMRGGSPSASGRLRAWRAVQFDRARGQFAPAHPCSGRCPPPRGRRPAQPCRSAGRAACAAAPMPPANRVGLVITPRRPRQKREAVRACSHLARASGTIPSEARTASSWRVRCRATGSSRNDRFNPVATAPRKAHALFEVHSRPNLHPRSGPRPRRWLPAPRPLPDAEVFRYTHCAPRRPALQPPWRGRGEPRRAGRRQAPPGRGGKAAGASERSRGRVAPSNRGDARPGRFARQNPTAPLSSA